MTERPTDEADASDDVEDEERFSNRPAVFGESYTNTQRLCALCDEAGDEGVLWVGDGEIVCDNCFVSKAKHGADDTSTRSQSNALAEKTPLERHHERYKSQPNSLYYTAPDHHCYNNSGRPICYGGYPSAWDWDARDELKVLD